MRSIFTAWEGGDFFSSGEWADPEIELVQADGPEPSRATGLAEIAAAWGKRLNTFADVRVEAEEYRELVDTRVLVLVRARRVAKTSGIDLDQSGVSPLRYWSVCATARSRGSWPASIVTAPSPTSAWRSRRCGRRDRDDGWSSPATNETSEVSGYF